MPLHITRAIYFGPFKVNSQVFHITPLSFALVNLKPLLPGHILVSPLRVVPRVAELSSAEITDLFHTVQRVDKMIQRVFAAAASNIAIQNGMEAGQSVSHVHVHIIPRRNADLDEKGGTDAIYKMMDGEEGDVGKHMADRDRQRFPTPDVDGERQPRGEEEMMKEAQWLAEAMEEEHAIST